MTNSVPATKAALATATAALFVPASAIDRAMSGAETAKQTWALCAATLLLAADSGVTIDDVKAELVAAAKARQSSKRKADAINSITDVSKGVSSTVAGWFYDLNRAHKNGLLPLLLEGKSLTGLRRATESTQKPSARKAGNKPPLVAATPAAPLPPIAPTSLAQLAEALEGELTGKGLAFLRKHQMELARIVAAAGTAIAKVEAATKAEAARKAAAKATKDAAKAAKRKAA